MPPKPPYRYLEYDPETEPDPHVSFFIDRETGERFAIANLSIDLLANRPTPRTSGFFHAVKPPDEPPGRKS